ncbi:MAG: type II secretion system GspH family protein [Lentisphaerales bacterium]|nr:type II secretion system GspH family protein [Lentisphaerales bacterium]
MITINDRSIRNNFTLIELLVVIAIIGILTSILLPSLSKARQAGFKAICTSNEKQLGILFQIYTTQNDEYYPTTSSSSQYISWDDMLADYDGRNLSQADKEEWHLTNIEDVDIYKCPGSLQNRESNTLTFMSYGINSTRVFAYPGPNSIRGIAGWLGANDNGAGWSISQSMIVNSSESIALMESHMFSNIMGHATAEEYINLGHFTWKFSPVNEAALHSDQAGGNDGLFIHAPKRKMMNYLYTDGHVGFMSPAAALGNAYPNFVSGTHNSSAALDTPWNLLD